MLALALILFFGGIVVAIINMGVAVARDLDGFGLTVVVHLIAGLAYLSGIVLFLIWAVQTLAG